MLVVFSPTGNNVSALAADLPPPFKYAVAVVSAPDLETVPQICFQVFSVASVVLAIACTGMPGEADETMFMLAVFDAL